MNGERLSPGGDMPDDPSRRLFLRLGIGAVVGVAAIPVELAVNYGTERVTGVASGNAAYESEVKERCAGSEPDDHEDCLKRAASESLPPLNTCVLDPLVEEHLFRGVPAWTSDTVALWQMPRRERKVVRATRFLRGSDESLTGRRELICGAVSTVLFAAAHNVTGRGFNTETIPASQAVSGGIYWFLQRRFGIQANFIAHAVHNVIVLGAVKTR